MLTTKRRWPLQADFAVVAVLVILAGAAAGTFVHLRSDADAKEAALADANFAARKAAAQISSGLDVIKLKSTQPVANTPTPAQDFTNPSGCRLGSAPIGAFDAGTIDIVRLDGSVVCSSRNPKPSGTIYAGAPWLQTAAPAFVAPTADPLTGNKVAVISYPIGVVFRPHPCWAEISFRVRLRSPSARVPGHEQRRNRHRRPLCELGQMDGSNAPGDTIRECSRSGRPA